MSRRFIYLIMTTFAALLVLSCGGTPKAEEPQDTAVAIDTVVATEVETMPAEPVVEEQPKAKAEPKTTTSKEPKGKQTIYVSGYGANGEVWGHVTLNGNKGRGTIHDADENTLTITCIRKGNELIATDQNSRQYVFKI